MRRMVRLAILNLVLYFDYLSQILDLALSTAQLTNHSAN